MKKNAIFLTVEDPIEFAIEGIGQTQVNTKVDMTFARGLRAILRQDPDVVMVGEIRDLENSANCSTSKFNWSPSIIYLTYQHCSRCYYAYGRYGR